MPDGTIYSGISPDTSAPIYTTPEDARSTTLFGRKKLAFTFNQAAKFAKQLNAEKYLGHDDWRVPSKNELNLMFNNRAAIGGFNETGSAPPGWYWSASSYDKWYARGQRFSDGFQTNYAKDHYSSVRLVRSGPFPTNLSVPNHDLDLGRGPPG